MDPVLVPSAARRTGEKMKPSSVLAGSISCGVMNAFPTSKSITTVPPLSGTSICSWMSAFRTGRPALDCQAMPGVELPVSTVPSLSVMLERSVSIVEPHRRDDAFGQLERAELIGDAVLKGQQVDRAVGRRQRDEAAGGRGIGSERP